MRILACLALVFIVSACTNMSDHERAQKAWAQNDIKAAREIWRPLAIAGEAEAQFRLGTTYLALDYPGHDPVKGLSWLHKAVAQGHNQAKHRLGITYKYGWVVPKDYAKSVYWLTQAANAGEGVMVESGVWHQDQAATRSTSVTSTPSLNFTPVITLVK